MITKGIIKKIYRVTDSENKYKYQVYIPLFQEAGLNQSLYCVDCSVSYTPGNLNSYVENDVVYLAFEDDDWGNPVIIGKLYLGKELKGEKTARNHSFCSDLEVDKSAALPKDTIIGNLKYTDLEYAVNKAKELDSKPIGTDVVHIGGSETITGRKTFNNGLITENIRGKSSLRFQSSLTNGSYLTIDNPDSLGINVFSGNDVRVTAGVNNKIKIRSGGTQNTWYVGIDTNKLTAYRTVSFPNKNGTLAMTDDYKDIAGYDGTKNQILSHDTNGKLHWLDINS